jgi:hypothetical protein
MIVLALWAFLAQGDATLSAAENLATAKSLYAAGSYEEALGRLSALQVDATADETDKYRALCLLALGRTTEAEQSLTTLVTRRPLIQMSEDEVSPRLVAMFHEVRKRVLPDAIRYGYAHARTSFEQKDYAASAAQLKELMQILADKDLSSQQALALADLRLLAEGFLKLSEAELAAASSARTATPAAGSVASPSAPAAAAAPAATASTASAGAIYSAADNDVTPPVGIARAFPVWRAANPLQQRVTRRGTMRIVIDEQGRVETATLVEKVEPSYDPVLLDAAKRWTFKPAMRNGRPVKFEQIIAVVLNPQ